MKEIVRQVEIINIGDNRTRWVSPTLVIPAEYYENMKPADLYKLMMQHQFSTDLPFMVTKQIIPETHEYYYKLHQPFTTLN